MSTYEIITHGYLWSDRNTVKFIERNVSGELTAKQHSFTLNQFIDHIERFAKQNTDFYNSLGVDRRELEAFANAVLSLNRKASKSPGKPQSKR